MSQDRLRDLRNLGPASERALQAVGIETPEQLDALGPAAAYVRLREADPRVTRTFLWALAGAALDLDWRELPDRVKTDLLRETGGNPVALPPDSPHSVHRTAHP